MVSTTHESHPDGSFVPLIRFTPPWRPTFRRVSAGAMLILYRIGQPHILSLLGQAYQPFGLLTLTTILL
jgi:hypothetical protein